MVSAQADTIRQRIVLIGDAGQLTNGRHPVVDAVRSTIPLDKKTTILFLGDNLYKTGLPDRQFALLYDKARAVLDSQIMIAEGKPSKVYMIPGNHDWENGARTGYDAILRQQLYVDFSGVKNVEYYPKDGCPGPEEVDIGNDIVVIMFDSQWWLQPYDKPGIESDCKCKSKEELVAQIQDIATKNANKLILLACHHPFKSNGIHGGFFTLKQHIFPFTDIKPNLYIPLPILGSIYPISRSVFGSPQDLKYPAYADMVDRISAAVKGVCPNVIFVSGHDHNLQFIREDGYNYIISGGGCKQNRTSKNKNSLFNNTTTGFSVLEVSTNNNVSVNFYTVTDSVRKAYSGPVLSFKGPLKDTAAQRIVEDTVQQTRDYITISASDKYHPVGGLRKVFMGQNYRKEWSQPVKMEKFRLNNDVGNFKVQNLVSGIQTSRVLELKDRRSGREYILRSVEKNPLATIPENFQGMVSHGFYNEMVTGMHPYAPMAFAPLAEVLGLDAPHPRLFFVGDDPALGIYQKLFANQVCLLEEKDPTRDNSDTKATAKVLNNMLEDNDHRPDEELVLRARLLDMVVGDYDRHFDQWRWGVDSTTKGKEVKGKIYYPIPRGRDAAFFINRGYALRLLARQVPLLSGFHSIIHRVDWLGYRSKDFDRLFLNNLDINDWKRTIRFVQEQLSDSVIRAAVHQLPREIDSISGAKLATKMINRRNQLYIEGLRYYRFVSRKVNIIGSNQKEYFKVSNSPEGLHVRVYEIGRGYDTSFIMYDRVFTPGVTKELRLYGLNDDDYFDVEEGASSVIKIRLIGGRGNDTFQVKGHVETLLYDLKDSSNVIMPGSHAKNRFSNDPPLNERELTGFEYNTTQFPKITLGYNYDDGFIAGAAIAHRTYGFRNLPYASDQLLGVLVAPSRNAFRINYSGVFNHITRKTDMLVNVNFASPQLRNFFGLGDGSIFNTHIRDKFYQTRYQYLSADLLFRKRLFENLHLMGGLAWQQYNLKYTDNQSTIIGKPAQVGLDSAAIFGKRDYLGGKFVMLIDNRNSPLLPTRGIEWRNELVAEAGLRDNAHSYIAYTSHMTVYVSQKQPPRLMVVLKFGGGHIFSKNYPYYQALSFGANTDMLGFRKDRFAGSSVLYGGMELRLRIAQLNSYILPGTFGLTGFYNAGRAWYPGDLKKNWHTAFGGGAYFVPYNMFIVTATVGLSEDERTFMFSIGTKFNITY